VCTSSDTPVHGRFFRARRPELFDIDRIFKI